MPNLKSPKNQNRRAAHGRPAMKSPGRGGGGLNQPAIDPTNPRP